MKLLGPRAMQINVTTPLALGKTGLRAKLKKAVWINWRNPQMLSGEADRIYFGHETCQDALPSPSDATLFVKQYRDLDLGFTLVTPFVNENGVGKVLDLVRRLAVELDQFEVVCNDWGVLWGLAGEKHCRPVIGRLLTSQFSDPRIKQVLTMKAKPSKPRFVTHLDGTRCRLLKRVASKELGNHYQSCPLDRPSVLTHLRSMGVLRYELSNVSQGIRLNTSSAVSYSLYIPDVLLSMMRRCPAEGEDLSRSDCAPPASCGQFRVWRSTQYPVRIFRRDNALFYSNGELPGNMDQLPLDRLVDMSGLTR